MNCLHVLASHCRENAHAIFTILIEFYPNFPLDTQDAQGNTGKWTTIDTVGMFISSDYLALLLSYKHGHGQLCRALVIAGANLSICNDDLLSIFTMPAASKALLVNILGNVLQNEHSTRSFLATFSLDIITREPPWGESETCLECGIKFTITNRRHHW
jgi:rabankyrin-5